MPSLLVTVLTGGRHALQGACSRPPPLPKPCWGERGEYLVTAIGGCNDCDTPMTANGAGMAHTLQGTDVIFAPAIDMPWAPHAPQLAGGPNRYNEVQFIRFMETGIRPDGSRATPPMPPFRLNEADARAVLTYIKTLPRAK